MTYAGPQFKNDISCLLAERQSIEQEVVGEQDDDAAEDYLRVSILDQIFVASGSEIVVLNQRQVVCVTHQKLLIFSKSLHVFQDTTRL